MAKIWSKQTDSDHYEVRSAGATIRLYRNGVCHSQWNPTRPLSGGIWDLLILPALNLPNPDIKNVLMLGFGGGAVARKLLELVKPGKIVGIDIDEVHLDIAKRFFGCDVSCELILKDAIKWVQTEAAKESPSVFDLIIDDLHVEESEKVPTRIAPLDLEWCKQLSKLTSPDGLLVFNVGNPFKLLDLSEAFNDTNFRSEFPYTKVFRIESCVNFMATFSKQPFSEASFKDKMKEICQSYPRCRGVEKRYESLEMSDTMQNLSNIKNRFSIEI